MFPKNASLAAASNALRWSRTGAARVITLSAFPAQVNQGGIATYTITASRVNQRRATRVNYAMSETAALGKDYTPSCGVQTILEYDVARLEEAPNFFLVVAGT